MSPRREAQSLLFLSLKSVELFVAKTIKIVAPEIVRHHNERSKRDLEQRLAAQSFRRLHDKNTNDEQDEEFVCQNFDPMPSTSRTLPSRICKEKILYNDKSSSDDEQNFNDGKNSIQNEDDTTSSDSD